MEDEEISREEALRSLAVYYQRRAQELEGGLVVANARTERLKQVISDLQANFGNNDTENVSND